MELLRLEHITKNFGKGDGKVAALRYISLKIDEGELVAIIGKRSVLQRSFAKIRLVL